MSTWNTGRISVTFGGGVKPAPQAPAADPAEAARWGEEGDRRRLGGDLKGADEAYARQMLASVSTLDLKAAAEALIRNDISAAQGYARAAVQARPQDPLAYWILADAVSRAGGNAEAEALLKRCLELRPDFTAARYAYAMVLSWRHQPGAALAEADRLLEQAPRNPIYRHLRATSLLQLDEDQAAADAYAEVLADYPDEPLSWMSYGHALKTLGRQADAVAAYRRALALNPCLGEAWWSLANLKTVRFSDGDVAAMEATLAGGALGDHDRLQLHFALGKALEDAGRDEPAFAQYVQGNAIQRRRVAYDADDNAAQLRRTRTLMTKAFFATRAGQGSQRPDPIFILGLPRSGSTLVEQILASHSQVEGTHELPHIPALAARLGGRAARESEGAYPDVLAALGPGELADLGEEYLARAQVHRKLGRPHFIDKLPNNFAHVGLIQLILPNARIVDARRHPLGCGFSCFKQHFAAGQGFTYDLTELGRYYRDYVELMAHFDAVLPGRVHRVIYERMVADPEGQVRALLDYCGLPFEAGCLKFHENTRTVRTASSEQVRQPIFTDAADHWRRFEPWLDPLKAALGTVLDAYPDAPA
jgi:tetratricopeptide (TPR) repeat protein